MFTTKVFIRGKEPYLEKIGWTKNYETILSEETIKECFISKGPLVGGWFKEFPLGLNRVIKKAAAERRKGLDWLDEEKLRNLFLGECKHSDLILVESEVNKVYERLPEKELLVSFMLFKNDPTYLFNGRYVYLIEAKTSRTSPKVLIRY
ncbi:MAG: hypothetical protein N0A00_10115 [Candidatus Bathyarchaeota archaeon]|nr:hypothetical protein [Candidatus Bathyarchaeota archaeon]